MSWHRALHVLGVLLLMGACVTDPDAPGDPGPVGCADGEQLDLDGVTCVPQECGVGTWGDIGRGAWDGPVAHVAAHGSDDGDGTEEGPFQRIEDGIAAVRGGGGGLVAVGDGTWHTSLLLGEADSGLVLAGRCAALTVIDGSEDDDAPVIDVGGGAVTVLGMTLTGGTAGARAYPRPASATIDLGLGSMALRGNHEVGLLVAGAATSVVADRVEVSGTEHGGFGTYVGGINVVMGGLLSGVDLRVEGNGAAGVRVSGEGSRAELIDTEVRDTGTFDDGSMGWGVYAELEASLWASGLVVEGNHQIGVAAFQSGTVVELESSVVRGTWIEDGELGFGLEVADGASMIATDVVVEGNQGLGVGVYLPGTELVLERVEIRNTLPAGPLSAGRGLEVEGGTLWASDLLLDGNGEIGALLLPGSETVLVGAEIRNTLPLDDGTRGQGLVVVDGALLEAAGLLLEGNRDVALRASGAGTQVTLESSEIRDTLPRTAGTWGMGMVVAESASVSLTDVVLENNRAIGLLARHWGTSVSITDSAVRGTRPQGDGSFGMGVHVGEGALLEATGLVVQDNTQVGLMVSTAGTVELQASSVLDTGMGQDPGGGMGVVVQRVGLIEAQGLEVSGSAGPGAFVADGGLLDCDDCVVAGNGFAGLVVLRGVALLAGGEISGSSAAGSQGGGLGVLAWDHAGEPALQLRDVTLEDHPGPAVYLRGDGNLRVEDCTIRRSGTAIGAFPVPAAVVVVEGVSRWHLDEYGDGHGLWLEGTSFEEIPTAGILLDASSASLDGNTFTSVDGLDLKTQHCESVETPEIVSGVVQTNDCVGYTSVLEPLPWWWPDLGAAEAGD